MDQQNLNCSDIENKDDENKDDENKDDENKDDENKDVENKDVENKNDENKDNENQDVENKDVENQYIEDECIYLFDKQNLTDNKIAIVGASIIITYNENKYALYYKNKRSPNLSCISGLLNYTDKFNED